MSDEPEDTKSYQDAIDNFEWDDDDLPAWYLGAASLKHKVADINIMIILQSV